jgi:quinol-cytochrome oxidoreductase complex cytochrome b subunit
MHSVSVNEPYGLNSKYLIKDLRNVNLFPYYFIKDMVSFFAISIIFILIICFYPERLGNPVNYIPANPEQTPPHITPE